VYRGGQRGAVAALLALSFGLAIGLLPGVAGAVAGAPEQSVNVTAVDAKRHKLPANPVLQPGDTVAVSATGFKPGGSVLVRTFVQATGLVTADNRPAGDDGIVRVTVSISAATLRSDYVLTLVGAPATSPAPRTPPAPPSGPTTDPQSIVVTVPQAGIFPYRVKHPQPPAPHCNGHGDDHQDDNGDGHGNGGARAFAATAPVACPAIGPVVIGPVTEPSVGGEHTSPHGAAGHGTLVDTGVTALQYLAAALLLIVTGFWMLTRARRRTRP